MIYETSVLIVQFPTSAGISLLLYFLIKKLNSKRSKYFFLVEKSQVLMLQYYQLLLMTYSLQYQSLKNSISNYNQKKEKEIE